MTSRKQHNNKQTKQHEKKHKHAKTAHKTMQKASPAKEQETNQLEEINEHSG